MKQSIRFFGFVLLALMLISGTTVAEKKVVTVFGPFQEPESTRFEAAYKVFEERTGIDVVYTPSRDFETLIFVRVEGGDPPDIAALPQPGLMYRFAKKQQIKPLWPEAVSLVEKNYSPVWKELGSYEGTPYGIYHRVNVKSLVWYPKKAWEKAGYQPPTTWAEMETLCGKMIKNGHTPWAIGVKSGGATGWPATDWMEDIMLRTAGPEVYDKWITHDIPFDDPAVKRAAEIMLNIWRDPKMVYGGAMGILNTSFGDAPKVMFEDPPKAWMHRQGNFITGFFPKKIQDNLADEVGVFGLPSIEPQWGLPVLGGGDQYVMFSDRPEVRQFMEFLATAESGEAWARAGGALFPHKGQNLDAYPDKLTRIQAEMLLNAEVFRFDASDMMPAKVGAGSFWRGMVDLVGGKKTDSVLRKIEKSWPK
ncbi:MAG: carbohydrate ABC transporter substrate-binding protein [Desulfobacteraceae bacterium]|nr:carbohydrate ABC transporter substrate-binding protein [Desulfobacteraceae bacterium]